MSSSTVLNVFLVLAALVALTDASLQKVSVKGQVICDKRSMRNIRIELREHDTFDPDDSLAETHSDKDGFFIVNGQEDETGSIRPYLRVTHNCDVRDRGKCNRTSDFEVPPEKVGENMVYDMNFVNLNIRGANDKETCI